MKTSCFVKVGHSVLKNKLLSSPNCPGERQNHFPGITPNTEAKLASLTLPGVTGLLPWVVVNKPFIRRVKETFLQIHESYQRFSHLGPVQPRSCQTCSIPKNSGRGGAGSYSRLYYFANLQNVALNFRI